MRGREEGAVLVVIVVVGSRAFALVDAADPSSPQNCSLCRAHHARVSLNVVTRTDPRLGRAGETILSLCVCCEHEASETSLFSHSSSRSLIPCSPYILSSIVSLPRRPRLLLPRLFPVPLSSAPYGEDRENFSLWHGCTDGQGICRSLFPYTLKIRKSIVEEPKLRNELKLNFLINFEQEGLCNILFK